MDLKNKLNEKYPNLDLIFYTNYYLDVKNIVNKNKNVVRAHYENHGFKENRLVSEKEFYKRYPNFDLIFYTNFYLDVKNIVNKNKYMVMAHYENHGSKENRLVSEKEFNEKYPNFDLNFYTNYYLDVKNIVNKNKYMVMAHYENHGFKENRIVSQKECSYYELEMIFFDDKKLEVIKDENIDFKKEEKNNSTIPLKIEKNKICIIYHYSEIKNQQTSQNNLCFFINYALDKKRWKKLDITTIFIIDGICEVLIPEREDIFILKKENGKHIYNLNHLLEKNLLLNKFTHYFLLNSNVVGPIFEEGKEIHWLDPFLNCSFLNEKEYFVGTKDCLLYKKNSQYKKKYATNQILSMFIEKNKEDKTILDFLNNKLGFNFYLPNITESHKLLNNQNKYCLIYSHYDKNNIIMDYVLQNIIMLMKLGFDIIFYTSSSKICNYNQNMLPFKINYFPNKPCGGGTDWYMWLEGSKKIINQNKKYEWIMLMNDSTAIGIHGLNNMKISLDKMLNSNIDFWGHWDSNEINYHYHSSLFLFKYNIINLFIEFTEKNLFKSCSKQEIILNCETQIINYLNNLSLKTDCIIKQKNFNFQPALKFEYRIDNVINCPSHNPLNISSWINNKNAFAIKWKYIMPYLDNKLISNEFKQIFRFIHIGKYIGYQTHFPRINIDLYRNNNMFENPYLFLELASFVQPYIRLNKYIQFY